MIEMFRDMIEMFSTMYMYVSFERKGRGDIKKTT